MSSHTTTTEHEWGCDDEEFVDASFCGGPSVIDCWDHSQVPQDELCPDNPCEEAGTCDHTDPVPGSDCQLSQRSARGYCPGEEGHAEEREDLLSRDDQSEGGNPAADINEQVTTAPEPAQAATLPHTGTPDVLAGAALGMIALGTGLVQLARRMCAR